MNSQGSVLGLSQHVSLVIDVLLFWGAKYVASAVCSQLCG